jgi:hypothetical protein
MVHTTVLSNEAELEYTLYVGKIIGEASLDLSSPSRRGLCVLSDILRCGT